MEIERSNYQTLFLIFLCGCIVGTVINTNFFSIFLGICLGTIYNNPDKIYEFFRELKDKYF